MLEYHKIPSITDWQTDWRIRSNLYNSSIIFKYVKTSDVNEWRTLISGGSESSPSVPSSAPIQGAEEHEATRHRFKILSDPPLERRFENWWLGIRKLILRKV